MTLERLATSSERGYDLFLQELWSHLSQTHELALAEAPEGIGDLPSKDRFLSYAVDRASRFAAFRWYEVEACAEAFFVLPADGLARTGFKICPLWRNTSSKFDDPAWWCRLAPVATVTESAKALPGFVELVALLASQGDVTTSNGEAAAAAESIRHELLYYQDLVDDQADELRQLRAKFSELSTLPFREDREVADVNPIPGFASERASDLQGLPAWAAAHEAEIVVMPRALNNAKKSLYKQPEMVYKALEYLAGPYRDMRLQRTTKDEADSALAAAGLRVAGSVGVTIAGEHGEAYSVLWQGRRRMLEQHLVRGGGRDERYCLRVYFFWDEDSARAVVGWLPSHLANSLS